jgi:hypothetical protein
MIRELYSGCLHSRHLFDTRLGFWSVAAKAFHMVSAGTWERAMGAGFAPAFSCPVYAFPMKPSAVYKKAAGCAGVPSAVILAMVRAG